jgi:chaperonin GroES
MTTDTAIPESDFAARLAAKAARDAEAEANSQVAQFEPIDSRVLAQRDTVPEEVKVGSILVPLTARERPLQATVLRVGPGRMTDSGMRVPMAVKPGDVVLIGKFSGTDVELDGRELLLLQESEIFGIVKRADR